MNPRRLYFSQAVLLLATLIPLALAEGGYWLLIIAILGIAIGWSRTIRQDRPILTDFTGLVVVILAFIVLIIEHLVFRVTPVLALAHFMVLVCVSKCLVRRTFRDHGQIFVLLLLLLVVAAIVSGDLLFPIALAVFLTVGVYALLRFHLALEAARVENRNQQVAPMVMDVAPSTSLAQISLAKPAFTTAIFSALVGIAIFVSFPRIGAGMLGQWENPRGAAALTGLSGSLKFNTTGPIHESEKPVMRVQIDGYDSEAVATLSGPYFRGSVLWRYNQGSNAVASWEWHRYGPNAARSVLPLRADHDGTFAVLPSMNLPTERMLTQRYWVEPSDGRWLFAAYPAVELKFESTSPDIVKKYLEDQVLNIDRNSGKLMRYTVQSARMPMRYAAEILQDERQQYSVSQPEISLPTLPRAAEIHALIDRLKTGIGPLDSPANQLALARRFEDYLHSNEFKYTLNPPPFGVNVEPVGQFLLTGRRGHCEYFAAAMAIMCQMSGIPARLAYGYCGGDFNAVGGFFIVRQKHAHSWVEVFIPGLDWVTFDPTPSRSAELASKSRRWFLGLSKYLDYFQFLWANLVVSYDADLRRLLFTKFSAWLLRPVQDEATILGAVAAFVRELFGWRLRLNWRERLIYWVFALLVTILFVLVGYVIYRVSSWSIRRLMRAWPDRADQMGTAKAEFYRRYARQLRAWGINRRPDQTPAEFASELAGKLPICVRATRLVDAYYQVAFGGQKLSGLEQSEIDSFLKTLAKADPAQIRADLSVYKS